jgi:hypothetical protein
MDFQPGSLLEPAFLVDLAKIATTMFAGAAVMVAGVVVLCVGRECGKLRRVN